MMEVSVNYDITNYTAASDSYEETLFGFFIGYFAVRLPGNLSNFQGLYALFFISEPSIGISPNLKRAIIVGVLSQTCNGR